MDDKEAQLNPTVVYWEEFSLALKEFFMSLEEWRQNPQKYSHR